MTGMRKMDNRGMMTVEAACIVPIILMIIVIEIFFGIFLIDMSSVKGETIRLADETADVWKTDGNLIDGTYKPQQLLSRNKNFLRHNNSCLLYTSTFCKYHNPRELLDRLSRFSDEMEDLDRSEGRREEERVEGREEGREAARTRLTMIYSPVYEEKLKEIARSFMKEGDVYIGCLLYTSRCV